MASRVKKPEDVTFEDLVFATAEQKLMRILLSEPTTVFPLRQLANRVKGVRGMGGMEGLKQLLQKLSAVGLIDWVDHDRAIRLRDDEGRVETLKILTAVCDLESLRLSLAPICPRGFLVGARAEGKAATDSSYEVAVITDQPEEAKRVARGHPLGKYIQIQILDSDNYRDEIQRHPRYVILWGTSL
ncbi:MAG: hypothetical protein ACK5QT_00385 [Oligoflexia bacterium]|jgi:hypothetical protein